MKNNMSMILAAVLGILITGCGKKQQSLTELQEPVSIEGLSDITSSIQADFELTPKTDSIAATRTVGQSPATSLEIELEQLPPSGPYRPTNQDIQTALKNARYYSGLIDGKIGPRTKKAIEDFQRANGLKIDGKVGPKTWSVLSKFLNPQPAPSQTKNTKKR